MPKYQEHEEDGGLVHELESIFYDRALCGEPTWNMLEVPMNKPVTCLGCLASPRKAMPNENLDVFDDG